jgi:hypothetical protein
MRTLKAPKASKRKVESCGICGSEIRKDERIYWQAGWVHFYCQKGGIAAKPLESK